MHKAKNLREMEPSQGRDRRCAQLNGQARSQKSGPREGSRADFPGDTHACLSLNTYLMSLKESNRSSE